MFLAFVDWFPTLGGVLFYYVVKILFNFLNYNFWYLFCSVALFSLWDSFYASLGSSLPVFHVCNFDSSFHFDS